MAEYAAVKPKQVAVPGIQKLRAPASNVPSVLADPDQSVLHGPPSVQDVAALLRDAGPAMMGLDPQFLRPEPPSLAASDMEVIWMNPSETAHALLWDAGMCVDNSSGSEVRALMKKACKQALAPEQQEFLSAEIEADHKLVYHIGLTPQKLPDLVEFNPIIAIEVLLKLMSSNQITECVPWGCHTLPCGSRFALSSAARMQGCSLQSCPSLVMVFSTGISPFSSIWT